jgi:hypothetical protein
MSNTSGCPRSRSSATDSTDALPLSTRQSPASGFRGRGYADLYQTVALGWLNDETLLMFVPAHSPTDYEHVLAWNYDTGQIERVTDVPAGFAISLATEELD